MIVTLWHYRGFIAASVRRDFHARYRASALGGLWAVINPLAQILVFTAVLAGVMRARLPGVDTTFGYSIFLTSGIITWGLFTEIVTRCTGVFVENGNLLKKQSFPRICLPAIVVTTALLNFVIILILFLGFLAMTGHLPGAPLIAMLPILAIQVTFAAGLGVLLGVANVFYRDIAPVEAIVLQFWFWLTPIIYPLSIVPPALQGFIEANPATAIARAYQDIFVASRWPDFASLAGPGLLALVAAVAGYRFFRSRSADMVDEL